MINVRFYISLLLFLLMDVGIVNSQFIDKGNVLKQAQSNIYERIISDINNKKGASSRQNTAQDNSSFLRYINNVDGIKYSYIERLLILGVGNSPIDAAFQYKKGYTDPFGQKYTDIVASSPDGNIYFDVFRAAAIDIGFPLHGVDLQGSTVLKNPTFVDQLDLHSQGCDAGINLLAMGKLKADTINFYAPPGGFGKYFTSSEKFQKSISQARVVNVFINAGGEFPNVKDLIPQINIIGFPVQFGPVSENAVGMQMKTRAGTGGTKINVYILYTKPGKDSSEKINTFLSVNHIYSLPRGGHQLSEDYFYNIRTLYMRNTEVHLPNTVDRLIYQVMDSAPLNITHDAWNVISEQGQWVLVGRGDYTNNYKNFIPVLLTTEENTPEYIAKQIQTRNERDYPDQKAIILLDGNPNSPRNRLLISELELKGYSQNDIYVVWDGDLYRSDGEFLKSGNGVIDTGVEKNSLLAVVMWGAKLRSNFNNRPVIAVHNITKKTKKTSENDHEDPNDNGGNNNNHDDHDHHDGDGGDGGDVECFFIDPDDPDIDSPSLYVIANGKRFLFKIDYPEIKSLVNKTISVKISVSEKRLWITLNANNESVWEIVKGLDNEFILQGPPSSSSFNDEFQCEFNVMNLEDSSYGRPFIIMKINGNAIAIPLPYSTYIKFKEKIITYKISSAEDEINALIYAAGFPLWEIRGVRDGETSTDKQSSSFSFSGELSSSSDPTQPQVIGPGESPDGKPYVVVIVNGRLRAISIPFSVYKLLKGKTVTTEIVTVGNITRIIIYADGVPVWEIHLGPGGRVKWQGEPKNAGMARASDLPFYTRVNLKPISETIPNIYYRLVERLPEETVFVISK